MVQQEFEMGITKVQTSFCKTGEGKGDAVVARSGVLIWCWAYHATPFLPTAETGRGELRGWLARQR